MWLFQKNVTDISEDDINLLIANKTLESVHLDFKQESPGPADKDKEEFRLDVCSMANGGGGLILYGVEESGGVITNLIGIPSGEVESTTIRMTQILRTGIEPNLLGVKIEPIKLTNGTCLIALKILRSFSMPHRTVDSRRFVIRHGAGKNQMSIEEIRAAFLFSSSYLETINRWVEEKVDAAMRATPNGVFQPLSKRLMIFVVPLSSLDEGNLLDAESIAERSSDFQPIGSSSSSGRYVAEGYMTHRGTFSPVGQVLDFAKVYRNGRIEAIDQNQIEGRTEFSHIGFERTIIKAIKGYLQGLKALDVAPPIVIKVVLNGVSGYCFTPDSKTWVSDMDVQRIL